MTKEKLSEIVLKNVADTVSKNQDSWISEFNALPETIRAIPGSNEAFFNFFMLAVRLGAESAISTLKELEIFDISEDTH